MTTTLEGRDYLRCADFSPEETARVLDLAARVKADRSLLAGSLPGRSAALLFEKPSLRTKASFSVASMRLGIMPVSFQTEEIGLGKRESVQDAAKVLARYFDVIVHRTFAQARIEELALHASVPVVNALSDAEHPCQALADLMTMRERFGDLAKLRLAYLGDGNNVCSSLLIACALTGAEIAVATPPAHPPSAAVVAQARAIGGRVEVGTSAADAVRGAHAVYTDTWASMGQEGELDERLPTFAPYRVDAALMAKARPDAIFLHCLPAHRGQEVTDEVMDSPASVIYDQAENRAHVHVAMLALLLRAA
jgi:ornithine carbamoyltransferase